MRPRSWVTHVLPEWNPETLPGYAEAKVERGESRFPAERAPVSSRRRVRSVESLTAERDALVARRDRLDGKPLPNDPGALSGIRRKPNPERWTTIDRHLAEWSRLTERIEALEFRIRKQGGAS